MTPGNLTGNHGAGAVGAGFAGFETAGNIFRALLEDLRRGDNLQGFYGTLALRAVLASFCHVVWTASVVGALWRVKGDQPFRVPMLFKMAFLRVLVFVMLLHMLWNSNLLFSVPGSIGFWKGWIFLLLTSFVGSWYLVLLLVQEGLREVEAAKGARSVAREIA